MQDVDAQSGKRHAGLLGGVASDQEIADIDAFMRSLPGRREVKDIAIPRDRGGQSAYARGRALPCRDVSSYDALSLERTSADVRVKVSMTWNVGVLIVGSLCWDQRRAPWRNQHLTDEDGVLVRVPICYGRKSYIRKTFTIVFAPGLPDASFGTARIRRCRRPIFSPAEVIDEAQHLWMAESNSPSIPGTGPTLSAYWGCVALCVNPRFLTMADIADAERTTRRRLVPVWAAFFREEWEKRCVIEKSKPPEKRREGISPSSVYGVSGLPGTPVNDDGLLQIAWPRFADSGARLNGFDMLLAVTTTPTRDPRTGAYPAIETIVDAWRAKAEFSYFTRNRGCGITTYQDENIAELLPDFRQSDMEDTNSLHPKKAFH